MSGFRIRRDITPHKGEVGITAAGDKKYMQCNGCQYVFKRKGALIDMRDFEKHKATCIGRLLNVKPGIQ